MVNNLRSKLIISQTNPKVSLYMVHSICIFRQDPTTYPQWSLHFYNCTISLGLMRHKHLPKTLMYFKDHFKTCNILTYVYFKQKYFKYFKIFLF